MPFPSRRGRTTDKAPICIFKEPLNYDVCRSDLFAQPLSRSASPDSSFLPPFPVDGPIINGQPNEVLYEIFNAGRYGMAHEGLWLLKVSSVCRRWRTVATRTPSLWSNIYFGEHMLSTHYTDVCLTRSQNCPLDITFRLTEFRSRFPLRRFLQHISQIAQHTARWRSLEIQARSSADLCAILSRLQNLEQLVQVTITLGSDDIVDRRYHINPVEAPRLTRITLCGVSFVSCNLPSDRLTSLTLTRSARKLTGDELKRILTASESLKQLSLSSDITTLGQRDWFTIRIPSLVSLTLFSSSESVFGHLCNTIVAPALQNLALHHFTRECIRLFIDSCRLYSPKYPKLRSFEIRTVAALEDLIVIDIVDLFDELASIDNFSMMALQSKAFLPIWPLLYCGHWENLVPEEYQMRAVLLNHFSYTPHYGYPTDTSVVPEWLQIFGDAIKPNPERRMLLPNLRTITMSCLDSDNLLQACILALSRSASGLPLAALRAYSMDRTSSVQEWLKEYINIEMIL